VEGFDLFLAVLGLAATFTFSAAGALTASRKQLDIIGFLLIGFVTAFGGGTVRDLLLGVRVFWMQEPLLVLSLRFRLSAGHDPAEISRRTTANLQSRTSTQPYDQPSCGSVFRNPEPSKAGQLIEALGLKGMAIGGAMVSPVHANFIVNTGDARAGQIEALIQRVQARVRHAHKIDLHPEVKRLGRFAAMPQPCG
jgi:UDP-N-acetylenolpyruvoylglucosamine reductase